MRRFGQVCRLGKSEDAEIPPTGHLLASVRGVFRLRAAGRAKRRRRRRSRGGRCHCLRVASSESSSRAHTHTGRGPRSAHSIERRMRARTLATDTATCALDSLGHLSGAHKWQKEKEKELGCLLAGRPAGAASVSRPRSAIVARNRRLLGRPSARLVFFSLSLSRSLAPLLPRHFQRGPTCCFLGRAFVAPAYKWRPAGRAVQSASRRAGKQASERASQPESSIGAHSKDELRERPEMNFESACKERK